MFTYVIFSAGVQKSRNSRQLMLTLMPFWFCTGMNSLTLLNLGVNPIQNGKGGTADPILLHKSSWVLILMIYIARWNLTVDCNNFIFKPASTRSFYKSLCVSDMTLHQTWHDPAQKVTCKYISFSWLNYDKHIFPHNDQMLSIFREAVENTQRGGGVRNMGVSFF